jgi:hypothetical protein
LTGKITFSARYPTEAAGRQRDSKNTDWGRSMPDSKTVFVLGAGASFEFGLPVGETLKETISKLLRYSFDFGNLKSGDPLIYNAISLAAMEAGMRDVNPRIKAARSIAEAMPLSLSIDNFLHIQKGKEHIEQCGKLAIVRSILSAESRSKLRIKDNQKLRFDECADTWAVRLVKLIVEQCSLQELEARLSKLTFIVFNYDRCLEHFIMHAFGVTYGISPDEAAAVVSKMNIYHPYGTVGELPWMKKSGIGTIDYGEEPQAGHLLQLSAGIKTFTEGTDDEDSDILSIRASVVDADRFVFLGYAYHPLNMKILLGDASKSRRTRRVFGTAFGMSKYDSDDVRDALDSALHAPSAIIRNDVTCYSMFHEHSRALSFT